jgi:predicted acyltransferase
MMGWLCGDWLGRGENNREKLVRGKLLIFGIICAVTGLVWDLFFPDRYKKTVDEFLCYVRRRNIHDVAGGQRVAG